MRTFRLIFLAFTAVIIVCTPAAAFNIQPGDHVQLRATSPAGVPLHKESKSSMFTRLPDRSIVKVLKTTHSNWLQVSHDGITGWIVKKYLAKIVNVASSGQSTSSEKADTRDVWESPGMCRSTVAKGASKDDVDFGANDGYQTP